MYVKNWCIYENIMVHILFSTVLYSFYNIFVNFGLINMFLGTFRSVCIGLQKASPNHVEIF